MLLDPSRRPILPAARCEVCHRAYDPAGRVFCSITACPVTLRPAGDPRYLLCPGHVRSANDGDWHFISARALAGLYGVPAALCVVLPEVDDHGLGRTRRALLARAASGDLIALHPRPGGDYSPPSTTP